MRPLSPSVYTVQRISTTPGLRKSAQEAKRPSLLRQTKSKLILSLFLAACIAGRWLLMTMPQGALRSVALLCDDTGAALQVSTSISLDLKTSRVLL